MSIDLGITKPNNVTDPLSNAGIRTVVLKYTYDIDMLEAGDLTKSFTPSVPGWKLDPVNSKLDSVNKILTLTLSGPQPLNDPNTQLGQIIFKATLPRTGNSSAVTLTSSQLLDVNGAPVPNCLTVAHQDTGITLVFQCGDSTLIKFMNDKPFVRIVPATPNPVTDRGSSVTFRYAQRAEGNITLSLYDALGNEVARILDNVHHPAGSFEVYYDTSKLPSGSYVYRYAFNHRGTQSGRLVIER
jgi:hypothetical protein